MKVRVTALVLALALLTGCASMLERSYSSASAHVEYTLTEDASILRAESYRGLVDALLYFVGEHSATGAIRLYNYTSPVEEDIDAARREVLEETPLGAFAVADITCSHARILSYYEVQVSISYSRTADQVEAVRPAVGVSAIQQALGEAMGGFAQELTLRISHFTGDEQALVSQAVRAYYDTPLAAVGLPAITVALYPVSGSQRIAYFTFHWEEGEQVLTRWSEELLAQGRQLLAQSPSAGEQYTLEELLAIMDRVYVHNPAGEDDPLSALSGLPSNELGWALGLELLLQLAQMEATLVNGALEGQEAWWLIAAAEGQYRHLVWAEEGTALYTDQALIELGYGWNQESLPACVDYSAEGLEPAEDGTQAEPETQPGGFDGG